MGVRIVVRLVGLALLVPGCMESSLSLNGDGPPAVTITSPLEGAVVLQGHAITMSGTVSDYETALAHMEVVWSSSRSGALDGTGMVYEDPDVSLDVLDGLEEGEHTITLRATDSSGRASVDTVTITAEPNSPPVVEIISPTEGDVWSPEMTHTLVASVTDTHDAVEDMVLVWESNLDGELPGELTISGNTVSLSDVELLTDGAHTLTLSVYDPGGAFGVDTVGVEVLGDENLPPTVEFVQPFEDTTIYEYWDLVYVEAQITDDHDSGDAISLVWSGISELSWVEETFPLSPTSDGKASVGLVLDCIYYDATAASEGPWAHPLILAAFDSEGASGQAQTSFDSWCLPID